MNKTAFTTKLVKKHANAMLNVVVPKIEQIIGPMLIQYPHWQPAFHLAIGFYGYAIALKQEEVNEFVKFLMEHPDDFREDIVQSKEFRDGFIIAFQDFLKIRTKEKKKVAKSILLGFVQDKKKDKFKLELLNDTLLKISSEGLKLIYFFDKNIIPMKKTKLKEDVKKVNLKDSGKNEQWWLELNWKRESLSNFVSKWIFDSYSPNSEKVRKQYEVTGQFEKEMLDQVFEIQRKKQDEINNGVEELIQLGILKIKVVDHGIGGGAASEYDFTDFGIKFLNYVISD